MRGMQENRCVCLYIYIYMCVSVHVCAIGWMAPWEDYLGLACTILAFFLEYLFKAEDADLFPWQSEQCFLLPYLTLAGFMTEIL